MSMLMSEVKKYLNVSHGGIVTEVFSMYLSVLNSCACILISASLLELVDLAVWGKTVVCPLFPCWTHLSSPGLARKSTSCLRWVFSYTEGTILLLI